MKPFYLVANWKSNKSILDAKEWLQSFSSSVLTVSIDPSISIILCAPYIDLPGLSEEIKKTNVLIHLAAQDISPFKSGAFTGEISADMLSGLVEYVLIGHSERRKFFQESDEELVFEVLHSHTAHFQSIYCIENVDAFVPESVDLIAYEPVSAIGSGSAENPDEANAVCKTISQKNGNKPVLYGGSVTEKNVYQFYKEPDIAGVLVGGASLDAQRFYMMLKNILPTQ